MPVSPLLLSSVLRKRFRALDERLGEFSCPPQGGGFRVPGETPEGVAGRCAAVGRKPRDCRASLPSIARKRDAHGVSWLKQTANAQRRTHFVLKILPILLILSEKEGRNRRTIPRKSPAKHPQMRLISG